MEEGSPPAPGQVQIVLFVCDEFDGRGSGQVYSTLEVDLDYVKWVEGRG